MRDRSTHCTVPPSDNKHTHLWILRWDLTIYLGHWWNCHWHFWPPRSRCFSGLPFSPWSPLQLSIRTRYWRSEIKLKSPNSFFILCFNLLTPFHLLRLLLGNVVILPISSVPFSLLLSIPLRGRQATRVASKRQRTYGRDARPCHCYPYATQHLEKWGLIR